MKVGFTGTQAGMTAEQRLAFARLLQSLQASEFHHGDCIGSDAQAHQIAQLLKVPALHIWPPLANAKRAFMKGATLHAAAGYIERNHSIVASVDVLVGAPRLQGKEEQRSGTWATIRQARRTHKPIFIVWPNGEVAHEQSTPVPAATPKPKQSPGPCIYKIKETRRPISQELLGYRILVAVPNMDGHEMFSSTPAPSFAPKYLVYESSDYGESELRAQLVRIFKHLITAGYTDIEDAERYADKVRSNSHHNFHESQVHVPLTDSERLQVNDDPLAVHMKERQHPYVW